MSELWLPPLISFNDGVLGVNFLGYHAGVGIGGSRSGGDLFVEAGTPQGLAAQAGLGGGLDPSGRAHGGLYAGAKAGALKASSGLSGGVDASGHAGGAAHASAGASGLEEETFLQGSSGIAYTGKAPSNIEINAPAPVARNNHAEINIDAENEVHAPITPKLVAEANVDVRTPIQEAHYEPAIVKEKHIYRTYSRPQHHNFGKTAYIGGYVGGDGSRAQYQPTIEKRIDVDAEGTEEALAHAHGEGHVAYNANANVKYRNPGFFQDIFNIPISTLKAVSDFLGNTARNTNVSVQKSFQADSESISSSPKHAPSSSAISSASEAKVLIETPSVPKVIDDIFAIPINTLTAVNKFLENNVPARKRLPISQDGDGESARVRLGPHARRRANKKVIVLEEKQEDKPTKEA